MIHILFSTARSGSTWYGSVLGKLYNADFLNEILHDEFKHSHKKNLVTLLQTYSMDDNCVIKIFPHHVFKNSSYLDTVLEFAESVEILVRREFTDQVKSLYIAQEYEMLKNPTGDTNIPHTWQTNFDDNLIINSIDHHRLETLSRRLKKELVFLSDLYQNHKFKLTYFEDIKDNFKDLNLRIGKLHRPVIWNQPFPDLDFDTGSLFK